MNCILCQRISNHLIPKVTTQQTWFPLTAIFSVDQGCTDHYTRSISRWPVVFKNMDLGLFYIVYLALYQSLPGEHIHAHYAPIQHEEKKLYFDLNVIFLVSEGRRAAGIASVWVARNRFAVLDKQQNVCYLKPFINFINYQVLSFCRWYLLDLPCLVITELNFSFS